MADTAARRDEESVGDHRDLPVPHNALQVQEVVDTIIDMIPDVYELGRCALVHRSWTHRSRHRRFSKLILASTHTDIPSPEAPDPTPRFAQFQDLARGNPGLLQVVQCLSLVYVGTRRAPAFPGEQHLAHPWATPPGVPWSDVDLSPLAAVLTNVRSIILTGFPCDSLLAAVRTLLDAFPLLQHVILGDMELPHPRGAQPAPWTAPEAPEVAHSLPPNQTRTRPLKHLALVQIQNPMYSLDGLQAQSFALVQGLARSGELSSLTELHVVDRAETLHPWLPFLPEIGGSLQYLTISVNDVLHVRLWNGFYAECNDTQLRDMVVEQYRTVSRSCPRLRELTIRNDGYPTSLKKMLYLYGNRLAIEEGYDPKEAMVSPFFLQQLAVVLAGPETPFPYLHTLAFELMDTAVRDIESWGDVWRALLAALGPEQPGDAVGGGGSVSRAPSVRYPHLRNISVAFEDTREFQIFAEGHGINMQLRRAEEEAASARQVLGMLEDAGFELAISAWKRPFSVPVHLLSGD